MAFDDVMATFPVEESVPENARLVIFGQVTYVSSSLAANYTVTDVVFRPAFNTTNLQCYLSFSRSASSAFVSASSFSSSVSSSSLVKEPSVVPVTMTQLNVELMPIGTAFEVVGGPFAVEVDETDFWFSSALINPIYTATPVVSCAGAPAPLNEFAAVSASLAVASTLNHTQIAFGEQGMACGEGSVCVSAVCPFCVAHPPQVLQLHHFAHVSSYPSPVYWSRRTPL
jgi:hypothetical protein